MGLPPTTRDAAMHPIIIPKEPELTREVVGNKLYGVEADETLETVISSIMDDDVDKRMLKIKKSILCNQNKKCTMH